MFSFYTYVLQVAKHFFMLIIQIFYGNCTVFMVTAQILWQLQVFLTAGFYTYCSLKAKCTDNVIFLFWRQIPSSAFRLCTKCPFLILSWKWNIFIHWNICICIMIVLALCGKRTILHLVRMCFLRWCVLHYIPRTGTWVRRSYWTHVHTCQLHRSGHLHHWFHQRSSGNHVTVFGCCSPIVAS